MIQFRDWGGETGQTIDVGSTSSNLVLNAKDGKVAIQMDDGWDYVAAQSSLDELDEKTSASDEELYGRIQHEITDRTDADNLLQSNIASEADDREAADANLMTLITSEHGLRKANDEILRTTIDELDEKTSASDEELYGRIQHEAADRVDADDLLQTNIANEADEREAGDLALQTAMGDRKYSQQNNVTNGDSLTKSIDDLDMAVGDVSKLNATAEENEHNAHHADVDNVVDALLATEAKVDTMIRRDGGSNSESTIIHLGRESILIDEATGDFSLDGESAIRTISALDGSFQDVATMDYVNAHLGGISNQLDDLTDELRTNLAANNAMSALVPNARSRGNTQVSFGTGGYRDAVGVAAGVFHYVGDGTLLNAGVSYSTGNQANIGWRAGVTFGF